MAQPEVTANPWPRLITAGEVVQWSGLLVDRLQKLLPGSSASYAVGQNGDIASQPGYQWAWGNGPIKGRLWDAGTADLQIRTNWAKGNLQDDGNKPGWAIRMGAVVDSFDIFRLSGGVTGQFLNLTSGGNLNLWGAVMAGWNNTAVGKTQLVPGSSTNPGYCAFFTADSTRRGYVGWSNGASKLVMVAENGWEWNVSGNLYSDGYMLPKARGCWVVLQNQQIGVGAQYQTIQFSSVASDPGGMANATYHQIIAPDAASLILLTLTVVQSNSNSVISIQQWDGSAWQTRASNSSPSQGQFVTYLSVSAILDTRYGWQFQATFTNNSGATVTLIGPNYFSAVTLGRTP